MARILHIAGFPSGYNAWKAKLFLQSRCHIELVDLKIQQNTAIVTVKNEEDFFRLQESLPSHIDFGGQRFNLGLALPQPHPRRSLPAPPEYPQNEARYDQGTGYPIQPGGHHGQTRDQSYHQSTPPQSPPSSDTQRFHPGQHQAIPLDLTMGQHPVPPPRTSTGNPSPYPVQRQGIPHDPTVGQHPIPPPRASTGSPGLYPDLNINPAIAQSFSSERPFPPGSPSFNSRYQGMSTDPSVGQQSVPQPPPSYGTPMFNPGHSQRMSDQPLPMEIDDNPPIEPPQHARPQSGTHRPIVTHQPSSVTYSPQSRGQQMYTGIHPPQPDTHQPWPPQTSASHHQLGSHRQQDILHQVQPVTQSWYRTELVQSGSHQRQIDPHSEYLPRLSQAGTSHASRQPPVTKPYPIFTTQGPYPSTYQDDHGIHPSGAGTQRPQSGTHLSRFDTTHPEAYQLQSVSSPHQLRRENTAPSLMHRQGYDPGCQAGYDPGSSAQRMPTQHHSESALQANTRYQTHSTTSFASLATPKKVYDWCSMPKLPGSPGERGILVQGMQHGTLPPQLSQFFADRYGTRGTVRDCLLLTDGVLFLFQHTQCVDDILNQRPQSISGSTVKLYPKLIPGYYEDKILLKNFPSELSTQSEEVLTCSLENCSSKGTRPESVKRPHSSVILINYPTDLDEDDMRSIKDNLSSRAPGNSSLEVTRLLKTDCVKASAPEDTSHITPLAMTTLLENKTTTGISGARVTRIDRVNDGSFLVYFTSYKDAEEICNNSVGAPKSMLQCHFSFELYFHAFSRDHKNLKGKHDLDSYYAALQEQDATPAEFEFNDVDAPLMKFFKQRDKHVELLKKSLESLAKIELIEGSDGSRFKVSPNPNGADFIQVQNNLEFKHKCTQSIKSFLKDYKSHSQQFSRGPLELLRQHDMNPKVAKDFAGTSDVVAEWQGIHSETLEIAGLASEVETTLTTIRKEANVKEDSVHLKPGQCRWMAKFYGVKDAKNKDDVKIRYDQNASAVTLFGNCDRVGNARFEVQNEASQITSKTLEPLDGAQSRYIRNKKNFDTISHHAVEIFRQQQISVVLMFEGTIPCIWGPLDQIDLAMSTLKSALSTEHIQMPSSAHRDVVGLMEWKTFTNEKESDGQVEIHVQHDKVAVTGFRDKVTTTTLAVKRFFEVNLSSEDVFPTEYGKAKFIIEHLDEFQQECKQAGIKHRMQSSPVAGIHLTGRKQKLVEVRSQLDKWNKKIIHKDHDVKIFEITEYFKSAEGKDLISKTSTDHKCAILLKDTSWPHQFQDTTESTIPFGTITVTVREGDITNETSCGILNTVGPEFDLNKGIVAKAILGKGGSQIQSELLSQDDKYLRVTSSGNLNCRKIFHVVTPENIEEIHDCLIDVLQEADKHQCISLSIPAIGTGNMRLPSAEVARIMHGAFDEFTLTTIQALKKVNVIIFEQSKIPDFKAGLRASKQGHQALGEMAPYQPSSPTSPTPSSVHQLDAPFYSPSTQAIGITQPSASNVFGPVKVTVRQGDITRERNDAIVNSSGSSFDLSQGMVAKAILTKGGQAIQTELSAGTANFLRVTSGGNLPCKKIFHVVIPNQINKLQGCITNILQEAERQQCSSISIPAIGTGNLGLKAVDVASIMKQALKDFAQNNPQTRTLNVVDVVIFDKSLIQDFKGGLFGQASPQPLLPSTLNAPVTGSSMSANSMGPIAIAVRQGDITNEKNDGIVNSVGSNFNLNQGLVSKAILNKGGQAIQTELSSGSGSMRVTSGGNLPCKKIFHVVVPSQPGKLKDCVKNLLREADNHGCSSLSIPAIGTGNLGLKAATIAGAMRQAFSEFAQATPQTKSLTTVDVVIFQQSLIQDFKTGLFPGGVSTGPGPSLIASRSPSRIVIGSIAISVVQGDIASESGDAIVVSTGTDFDLSQGIVGRAILKKAGPQIQAEVSKASGTHLRTTGAGHLACKKLFHVVVQNESGIEDCIENLLEEAERQQFATVSLPAIGSGSLQIGDSVVAKHIRCGFEGFANKYPQTNHLREVRVVIFDNSRLWEFQSGLAASAGGATSKGLVADAWNLAASTVSSISHQAMKFGSAIKATVMPSNSERRFGQFKVHVKQGDVTCEKTDAIVNSCRRTFDLSYGEVSASILSKGGQQLKDEVLTVTGTRLRVTSGGQLPCKYIFHVAFTEKEADVKDYILDILQEAENRKCISVAIPAVGTGNKKISISGLSYQMLMAFTEFSRQCRTKHLKDVNIVIFEATKLAQFKSTFAGGSAKAASKSTKKREYKTTLHFYSQRADSLKKAWEYIDKELQQLFLKDVVKRDIIKTLNEGELDQIMKAAHRYHVGVTHEKAKSTIIVEGERDQVWSAVKDVEEFLHNLKTARDLQRLTPFCWQYHDKGWIDFNSSANKKLEELYQKHEGGDKSKQQASIQIEGEIYKTFTVDFEKNSIEGSKTFHIRREMKDELPSHWDKMNGKKYLTANLPPGSSEYDGVAQKMKATIPNCQIQLITRIQNRELYVHYQQQKRMIRSDCTNAQIEQDLFHGTTEDTAKKIVNYGFDRNYAGKNATAYGQGTYFAKNASYSNQSQYASPDGKGVKTIVLAHVLTGDYCQGASGMKSAPTKPNSVEYNSVVDSVGSPTIFVIFKDAGAYPAYVIKYK